MLVEAEARVAGTVERRVGVKERVLVQLDAVGAVQAAEYEAAAPAVVSAVEEGEGLLADGRGADGSGGVGLEGESLAEERD